MKNFAKFACAMFAVAAMTCVGNVHAEETKDVAVPTSTPAPAGTEIWQDVSRVKKSGDYEYHIISEKEKMIAIRKIENASGKLVIPETIDGYKVIGVGRTYTLPQSLKIEEAGKVYENLWANDETETPCQVLAESSKKVTEITVPSNVLYIGENAFSDYKKLKKINFEKRTETLAIELGAFAGCKSLKNLQLSSKIVFSDSDSGNYGAFANCGNLDTVKVATSSLEYGKVFSKTKIKNLYVEGKNTNIADPKAAFTKIKTLTTVKGAKVIKLAKKYKVHYQICMKPAKGKIKVKDFTYNKKTKKWKEKSNKKERVS